ncbi:6-phosphogluconolactonase [Olivibacter sp. SDN3]|uniref:6-phosphogluconolactonase n=1 Tax=Olivibacter sp. SDN3 TaxID=2764720 RepID=UPI0016513ACC|nr:6-phosphogluconolactonase [Olivibacter sp. SDN3]QNL50611.1 6-phosphogluconolactonase [Olivibacter sp. SDN3]
MVKVFKNLDELSHAAATLFTQTAQQAIAERGRFTVALTGGSSPAHLYKLLTQSPYQEQIAWERVFVFWGDERWVPLEDDKSNAKMAFETLLNHVPIPREQLFPMWAAGVEPTEFAAQYARTIQQHVGASPQFDFVLLGMGEDGHTASLFPNTSVLQEKSKWVDAYYLAPQHMYRITLTAPILNQAKKIAVIVFGENKAQALYEVLKGKRNPAQYPAQLIQPQHGELIWLVDQAANR